MPKKKKAEVDTSVFQSILETKTVDMAKITVKKWLTTSEQISFCDFVIAQASIHDIYRPVLYDFARKYATLMYYTDIAIPDKKGILNDLNAVLYETDIIEEIYGVIDMALYGELVRAVKENISHIQHADLTRRVLELESSVTKLRDQCEDIFGNVQAINEYVASQFDGVDMQAIAASLNDAVNTFTALSGSEPVE